ncbi:hypothetical protein ACTXPP_11400 [Candidatus Corynebacterium faecigallinarum]|uniref:hypothetical protein n=1 Tax=Candidatus Corynebacterium faecigallinarum TaxID=2838528 RepID=UPI003FD6AAEC
MLRNTINTDVDHESDEASCVNCGHPAGDHANGDFGSLPVAAGEVQCSQCRSTTDNAVELWGGEWVDGDPDAWLEGYACSPECFVALLSNAVDPGYRRARLALLKGCKADGDDGLPRPFGLTNNTTEKEKS